MQEITLEIKAQINRARMKAKRLQEVRTSDPNVKDAQDRLLCLQEVIDILNNLVPKRGVASKKTIIQSDLDGKFIAEFKSVSEAANSVGRNGSNITHCLKKRAKSAYGFTWKYKN